MQLCTLGESRQGWLSSPDRIMPSRQANGWSPLTRKKRQDGSKHGDGHREDDFRISCGSISEPFLPNLICGLWELQLRANCEEDENYCWLERYPCTQDFWAWIRGSHTLLIRLQKLQIIHPLRAKCLDPSCFTWMTSTTKKLRRHLWQFDFQAQLGRCTRSDLMSRCVQHIVAPSTIMVNRHSWTL